jgi:UDP-2,3-diacylglucosamine pyrophosphatase LpxH
VREVTDVLKHTLCEKLVLNGDIVDGWALRRGARWRNRHTKFVRCVLKKTEKEGAKVIYVRGNHDGRFELIIYDQFLERLADSSKHCATAKNRRVAAVAERTGLREEGVPAVV